MKRTPLATATAASLYAIVLALPSPAALAATSNRSDEHTAAGMCVPATYLVSKVRNRPTGLRNESTGLLYVTCSESASWLGTGKADQIFLQVANFGASDATINCTLFTGYPLGATANPSQGIYPMSQVVAPDGAYYFNWDSTALTGSPDNLLNASWSCSLPPGAEIRATYREYKVDVGN